MRGLSAPAVSCSPRVAPHRRGLVKYWLAGPCVPARGVMGAQTVQAAQLRASHSSVEVAVAAPVEIEKKVRRTSAFPQPPLENASHEACRGRARAAFCVILLSVCLHTG